MKKYRVIDTKGHLFPLDAIVTKADKQYPEFFQEKIIYVDNRGESQALSPDQVQDLDLASVMPRSLLDVLLAEPLPYSLASHFKSCSNIRELFEIPSSGYVLQCIDHVTLTPFERVTLKALFDAYLMEIA